MNEASKSNKFFKVQTNRETESTIFVIRVKHIFRHYDSYCKIPKKNPNLCKSFNYSFTHIGYRIGHVLELFSKQWEGEPHMLFTVRTNVSKAKNYKIIFENKRQYKIFMTKQILVTRSVHSLVSFNFVYFKKNK